MINYIVGILFRFLRPFVLRKMLKFEGVIVLCFHKVSENSDEYYPSISPEIFDKLCQWIKQDFDVVTFDDLFGSGKKPRLIISFDDAYLNFYQEVLPILDKYGFKAVLNVISSCPENGITYHWQAFVEHFKRIGSVGREQFSKKYGFFRDGLDHEDYVLKFTDFYSSLSKEGVDLLVKEHLNSQDFSACLMMNWSQIREVADQGHQVGTHTQNHYYLTALNRTELRNEVLKAREAIEKNILGYSKVMAAPGAQYDDQVIACCRSLGFNRVLLMGDRMWDGKSYEVDRILCYGSSLERLLLKVYGIEGKIRGLW